MAEAQLATRFRNHGGTFFRRGLVMAAKEEFDRWLAAARETGNPANLVPPLNALAAVFMELNEWHRALEYQQEALQYVDDPRVNREDCLKSRLNLVLSYANTGNLNAALEQAQEAQRTALQVPSPFLRGITWLDLSLVHLRRREWGAAREAAKHALKVATALGDEALAARSLNNLGLAHLEMGMVQLAFRDLNRALKLNLALGRTESASCNHTELGRLCFMQGKVSEALEHGRLALDVLLSNLATLDKEEVARVSELFGTIFAGAGKRNLALKYLNRSAAYYSQRELVSEWSRVTGQIGRILTGQSGGMGVESKQEEGRLDFLTAVLDVTDDIESVDPHLRGHSERVTHYSLVLGKALGLTDVELSLVNYASRLHDVGYVAVDAEILQKPGPLTPAERERLKVHPVVGEEMLRPYGLPEEGLLAIRYHHEWWDGSGYPHGLKGEEIPLLARVIAIADVYDALTNARSFRDAMTHSQAMAVMRDLAGRHLDPCLVQKFVELHQI